MTDTNSTSREASLTQFSLHAAVDPSDCYVIWIPTYPAGIYSSMAGIEILHYPDDSLWLAICQIQWETR